MDQLQEFSNKYNTLEKLGEVQGRLNRMLIDAGEEASTPST
jgi:hypothetical protein